MTGLRVQKTGLSSQPSIMRRVIRVQGSGFSPQSSAQQPHYSAKKYQCTSTLKQHKKILNKSIP